MLTDDSLRPANDSPVVTDDVVVDLHMHTTCSDGVLQATELFAAIRAATLTFFSVTDHDNMAAYPMPPDLRERCIPGLEVDSELGGHTVHVLAYGVAPAAPLVAALEQQRVDRLDRMASIVDRLRAAGHPIEMDDVRAQAGSAAAVGRPHLARALVARGIVSSVQEAFDAFLADDGPAFVPLKRLSSRQIIELIHESSGVAVVAHPLRLRAPGDLTELVAAGADGIEVCHPTAAAADRVTLRAFAAERNLLVTGGTDFHAPSDGAVRLGVEFARRDMERLVNAIAVLR